MNDLLLIPNQLHARRHAGRSALAYGLAQSLTGTNLLIDLGDKERRTQAS
jgi:hypothetical protein